MIVIYNKDKVIVIRFGKIAACMVNKINKVIEINFQLSGAGNRLLADSVLL